MDVDALTLRYLVAAADHRSFRRAATFLNIAQPTLSKRVREIEDWLGAQLFERAAGGAVLTSAGEEFVISARRILAELQAMENRARAGRVGGIGRLGIGFYTSLSTGALRDALLTFVSEHPDVDVDIVECTRASLIPLLDRGAIDVVIVLGEPACADYANIGLWSERILVALSKKHKLAVREFLYWTDLKSERFLISRCDPGPEMQDILIKKLASPGDRPRIKLVDASNEAVLSVVSGNCGATLICESSAGNVLSGIVYREVRDGNGSSRLGYVAYWRRANENPALKKFLRLLQTLPAARPSSIPLCDNAILGRD